MAPIIPEIIIALAMRIANKIEAAIRICISLVKQHLPGFVKMTSTASSIIFVGIWVSRWITTRAVI